MEILLEFNTEAAIFLGEARRQIINVDSFKDDFSLIDEINAKMNFLYDSVFILIPEKTFNYGDNFARINIQLTLQQFFAEFKDGFLKYSEPHPVVLFSLNASVSNLDDCSAEDYDMSEATLFSILNPYINKLCRKIKEDLNLQATEDCSND